MTDSVRGIIEFLDEVLPLLPRDAEDRAFAREVAEIVDLGAQPLQNLSVMRWIQEGSAEGSALGKAFATESITTGFAALEKLVWPFEKLVCNHRSRLEKHVVRTPLAGSRRLLPTPCCTSAVSCTMQRFDVDLAGVCPVLLEIKAMSHPPEEQPDASPPKPTS